MAYFKLGFVFVLTQVALLSAVKDGLCPRAAPYGPCFVTCGADEDCGGPQKCCSNGCGSWCVEPMCPLGQKHVNCPTQLCNYAGCPGKPQGSLRCVVETCGKCSVKFINTTTGATVDCGPVETMCKRMLAATQGKPLRLGQYVPTCDSTGHFERVQCHEGYCFCVDNRGIPDMTTMTRFKQPKCSEKTVCEKKKEDALKLPAIGRFVPLCKSDGSFEEKQCHASTGQCWCVDVNGNEWLGTRSRGDKLDCKTSVCPADVKQLQCDPLLCHTASCPSNKNAVCRVNPCGKCEPEFLDQYGRQVNCFSKCQQQRLEALGTSSLDEKPKHPLVGRFVPQCAPDGAYEEVQCYASTGYCWCVDVNGSPVVETMTRGMPQCNKTAVGVCPLGKPMFTCLRNFCQWSTCPAHPEATCRLNPCGGCSVEFVDKNGKVVDCHQGQTKCQEERAKATAVGSNGLQPVGRFVPQCESNGNYSQIQCWASTGYCWCTDKDGKEVHGTRVRGKPNCSPRQKRSVIKDGYCPAPESVLCSNSGSCKSDGECGGIQKCCDIKGCGKVCQKPLLTACPYGTPFLLCLHMCNFAKCPAFPKATCFSDPCKMCKVEFRDEQGNVVNCTQGLTPCQVRKQSSQGLLGEFVPKCKSDGSYQTSQCHEGYCWCVDVNGREVNGTKVHLKQPTCTALMKSDLTLCQLQRLQSGGPMPGRYVPQCKSDGSFEEVQCHGSTGYCWCVDTRGMEIKETKVRGRPSCTKVCAPVLCRMYCQFGWAKGKDGCDMCKCAEAPTKPGFCPAVQSGQVGTCADECHIDDDCTGNRKCCSNGCGHICTSPEYKAKPGHCPAVELHHVGICRAECSSDSDCQGDQKCCSNGCGRTCSAPARQACPRGAPFMLCRSNPCEGVGCASNPKATCRANSCGLCRADFFDEHNNQVNCTQSMSPCQQEHLEATSGPTLLGKFVPSCSADGSYVPMQCHGSTGFCWCVTDQGKEIDGTRIRGHPKCLSPCQKEHLEATSGPALLGKFVPSCSADGSYAPMQCHGSTGFCWCVTDQGKEINGTRIRGNPQCELRTGPLCEVSKRWTLCGDVCQNATCTRNPDAKCVAPMGGCGQDACKPKFYDTRGEEVQCLTECQQKALQATSPMRVGAFLPKCNADGSYARVQCWGSTGYCWCVSEDGTEWPGSRIRGQPNCDVEQGPQLLSIRVGLTFNYSFSLVRDVLKDFKESLKTHLVTMFKLKDDQLQALEVREGSILVGFSVVPSDGGRDLSEVADAITEQARNHKIVIRFSGMTLVAEPNAMIASPMYEEVKNVRKSEDEDSAKGGVSVVAVAFIAVFCTLAVVVVGFVAFKLIQKRRQNSGIEERTSIMYRDGKAESFTAPSEA